jgi:hypothetical protein
MKAKGRKGPSPPKGGPKAAARAADTEKELSGTGFAVNSTPEPKESTDAVVKENVSGSSGDSTPHRAFSPSGRAVLEDPLSATDSEERVEEETTAVAAPSIDRSKLVADPKFRWNWDVTPDAVIEQLAAARSNDYLEVCIVTNRDHVSDRALYRFTSGILQAESQGAVDEAASMRSLRADVIRICWEFDRPLRERLYDAEARLVTVLKDENESNIVRAINRECGSSTVDVNSFWIVAFAAVAAWEAQSAEGREEYSEVQLRLKEIAEASRRSEKLSKFLSPSLSLVQLVLTATDAEKQSEVIHSADEEIIREMGVILEQIRQWPSNAYGEFIQKLQDVRDYAVQNVLGCPLPNFDSFRFSPSEIERGSRLVDFQVRNASRQKAARER